LTLGAEPPTLVVVTMIQFDNECGRFVYRAAGVITRGDEILLHTFPGADFWCMPGGRMEMNEPGRECVRREIIEEMGLDAAADVRVGRLIWVIENMYEQKGTSHHECGLYFAATLPAGSKQMAANRFIGHEWDDSELTFQWYPIASLPSVNLLPAVLRDLLQRVPEHTEYVLCRDGA
jgi:ADP-ribose pyrophosphatase YjhB (NUDIX family)